MKLPSELKSLFERDLDRLTKELTSYESDDDIWSIKGDIKNSAGTLVLHICGNLQHFVGAVLDSTGYERDREFEFNGRTSKKELLESIEVTKEVVYKYFDRATMDDMFDPYPLQPFGYPMTKSQFLIHLYGHLNWHLGQIDYHRRLK